MLFLQRKLMKKLECAARVAACSAAQLINAAAGCASANRNQASHTSLMHQCKAVADDVIPELVQAIKAAMKTPENGAAQVGLINAAQNMLQPGGRLVQVLQPCVCVAW